MESLALTVDEVINVRRVLVKAEMEKFLQSKELYNNLKRGKVGKGTPTCCFSLCCVYSNSAFLSGLLLLQSKIPPLLVAVHLLTV